MNLKITYIYYLLQAIFFILFALDSIKIEGYFIWLNISFSIYVIARILTLYNTKFFLINPIVVSSLFMFLLSYGVPILIGEYGKGIRYFPQFTSLCVAMIYVNIAYETLWISFFSKPYNKLVLYLKRIEPYFRERININNKLIYIIIIVSVFVNFISIKNGNYGVLSTIYADESEDSSLSQLNHYMSLGLSGITFLLAWQYFKYSNKKWLFYFVLLLNIFFKILSGYKGNIVFIFIILFISHYISKQKIDKKILLVCMFSIVLAYGIVSPYRYYVVFTKSRPTSVSEIVECISNGITIQNKIIEQEDVPIIEEISSRFTTLPELATFIEYKEKNGLKPPRDPDFTYLLLTTPFQIFIPRFIWTDKPVNDYGIWWVSNRVVGNMANTSTAFGPLGFLYLSFGIFTIIIGFMIISLLLKFCYFLIMNSKEGAVLTGFILLSSLYTLEAGYNVYVNSAIRMFFIGFIFQLLILTKQK